MDRRASSTEHCSRANCGGDPRPIYRHSTPAALWSADGKFFYLGVQGSSLTPSIRRTVMYSLMRSCVRSDSVLTRPTGGRCQAFPSQTDAIDGGDLMP